MSSAENIPDPDALRVHFGLELRRLRLRAGLSMKQLADALGCTPQWVCQLEGADKAVPEQSALDLDTYFKTDGWETNDGSFQRMYVGMRRAGQRRVLRPGFSTYLAEEPKAIGLQCFAAQIVPGLLQLEDYARGIMDPNESVEVVDDRVAVRLERQGIFTRSKPPEAMFIIDESALHRPVGGPKVMVDQIDHLIGMAQAPRVQIRIMPFDRITPVGLTGGFILLSFAKGAHLLYAEAGSISQVVEDRDAVFKAGVQFNTVMGEALSRGESIEFLSRAREEYL